MSFRFLSKSPLIILSLPLWDFSKGPKNEFEAAVVDEPPVFEPLKFYCISYYQTVLSIAAHIDGKIRGRRRQIFY